MEDSKASQGVMWDETRRVLGCAMRVLNQLGSGLPEKPCDNALVVELAYQGIPFRQPPRFDVVCRGTTVGQFVPDRVVFDGLVVETKVIDQTGETEYRQVINDLRVTGLQAGLPLNFRQSRLQWKRVVL